ncbi:MAG: hypothetical protein AAGE84_27580 [Cyanobacteria bacterium P01_G01_bin.39]
MVIKSIADLEDSTETRTTLDQVIAESDYLRESETNQRPLKVILNPITKVYF